MKIKLILPVIVVIMALSLPGCQTAGKEVPVQVTYDEFIQQKNPARNVIITKRDVVTVTLPSNPSTGFKWELTSISDPSILQKNGESNYVLPESPAVGAAGQEIWAFRPLQRGTSTISLAYSQPWEGGTKKEWTIAIEVKIR